jgi:sugar phosphate isomerase/epimerase
VKVGNAHLTYCTNIHPGESWAEVRANLERHVVAVKQRVSPRTSFGVGLRLSARAAAELDPDELADLLELCQDHDLYVFTINGFPYGPFHGEPVKEAVYRPDWLERERVDYTNRLGDLLAELLPRRFEPPVDGTISTVPGCFRARGNDATRIAENLARVTDHLAALEARTGKHLALALEPEPACLLETIADAIAFFDRHVPDRSHVGLCLDACHAAVEFEDLPVALAALRTAEIPIAKVQLSCGLAVAPVDAAARAALAPFAEGVYLHQVVARRGQALTRFDDLPAALADPAPADEWRIHFHVPIFRAELGPFRSTQPFLAALLAEHKRAEISTHLEVETYTWEVLPREYRAEPIEDAIARELRWVTERLA